MNPNNYRAYNNLGAVLEKMGNYESAVQTLMIGLKLNPQNALGWYNLGVLYDKVKNYEKAIEAYENAIKLGHSKKEGIKKRIEALKLLNANSKSYNYSFKAGISN